MMDYFYETGVERQMRKSDKIMRNISFAVTVVFGVVYFTTFNIQALGAFVLFIFMTMFVYSSTHQAFDYTMTGTEIDFTRISNGSRRKILVNVEIGHDLTVLAPSMSDPVKPYVGKRMPTYDFTSHREGVPYYTMIAYNSLTGRESKILFEADEEMVDAISRIAPSKVHKR